MRWILETDRLKLRELGPDDAAFAFELNADPQVVRYTGDEPFASVEAAQAFLAGYADYRVHGMGRWLVVRKSDGEALGWCGLKRHPTGEVDVGYRFFRRHWGKGYATEACAACIEYGFRELGLEQIVAHAMVDNAASIRVMVKCHMSFSSADEQHGQNAVIYRIERRKQERQS